MTRAARGGGVSRGSAMKLSIIIPVYNERATVRELIRRVLEVPLDKELIVVDDGSTDGTREILADCAGRDDVTVLHHEHNRGKGTAVRTGLERARKEHNLGAVFGSVAPQRQ